jgi:hypothetical protein
LVIYPGLDVSKLKNSNNSSCLTKGLARKAADKLANGESVASVAKELDLNYMAVYKIATGKTWKEVTGGNRLIAKRKCCITAKHRAFVSAAKAKSKTNAVIARRLDVSETTVARIIRDNLLIEAHKLRSATLTSGDPDTAARALGIKPKRVEKLLLFAAENPLPGRLAREMAEEDG